MNRYILLKCDTCGFHLAINEVCKTNSCPNCKINEQLTLIEGNKEEIDRYLTEGLK
jgi:predicted Zn-ribbon and HTH transcriptional regulator